VKGRCGKVLDKELHNVTQIMEEETGQTYKWAAHGEPRNLYKILVGKSLRDTLVTYV
jgi:hypothetical protein